MAATAELGDWFELDRYSKTLKKSPIGFVVRYLFYASCCSLTHHTHQPFVDVCIKHNATREAVKYIARCNPEQRAELFIRVGAWAEAAEAAFQAKDFDALHDIRQRCGVPKIASQVDQYLALLNKR